MQKIKITNDSISLQTYHYLGDSYVERIILRAYRGIVERKICGRLNKI